MYVRQLRLASTDRVLPCCDNSRCIAQVYTNGGVASRGRAAIVQRLQSMAELHATLGSTSHVVDTIESQSVKVLSLDSIHLLLHF